jgi:hypothetical protein
METKKKGELSPPAGSPAVVVQALSLSSARDSLASRVTKRGKDRAIELATQD